MRFSYCFMLISCLTVYTSVAVLTQKDKDCIPQQHLSQEAADLWSAVEEGDEEQVRQLVTRDNVNTCEQNYYTLLHIAAQKGYANIASCLIECGADLYGKSNQHTMPVHLALEHGHLQALKVMLPHMKRDINDSQQNTLLHQAVMHGHKQICSYLSYAYPTMLMMQNASCQVPLHIACAQGHLAIVRLLIRQYPDSVHNKDKRGRTPLHVASRAGSSHIVQLLLEAGSYVDAQDCYRQTPLCLATSPEATRALIHAGADIDYQIPSWISSAMLRSKSPLHCVAARGEQELIDVLVENGADLDIQDDQGNTPLHVLALRDSEHRTFAHFVALGAQLELSNCSGTKPYQMARLSRQVERLIYDYPILQDVLQKRACLYCKLGRADFAAANQVINQISNEHGKAEVGRTLYAVIEQCLIIMVRRYQALCQKAATTHDTLDALQKQVHALRNWIHEQESRFSLCENLIDEFADSLLRGEADASLIDDIILPRKEQAARYVDTAGNTLLHIMARSGTISAMYTIYSCIADIRTSHGMHYLTNLSGQTPCDIARKRDQICEAYGMPTSGFIAAYHRARAYYKAAKENAPQASSSFSDIDIYCQGV